MKTTLAFTQEDLQSRDVHQPRLQRIILMVVLGLEAIGAIIGGTLLILEPNGALLAMPIGVMNGVFNDFLVPGIILLSLGMLTGAAFFAVTREPTYDWLIAGLALGGLVIWFVVEIIIMNELLPIHLISGMPVLIGWFAFIPLLALRNPTIKMQRALLVCGILSSLWYVAINIYVPTQDESYNVATLTVSELSAIGAPTRLLWVLLALLYPLLFCAFGWGILHSFKKDKRLRLVGTLIIIYCVFNLYWPPMHMRGVEPALTDTLHIVWAIATNLFMWMFMVLGAAALNMKFRIYTITSIALHIFFGVLTFMEAPNIPTNGPTPTIGIWERINIGVFMLWLIVFALMLLRKENSNYKENNT